MGMSPSQLHALEKEQIQRRISFEQSQQPRHNPLHNQRVVRQRRQNPSRRPSGYATGAHSGIDTSAAESDGGRSTITLYPAPLRARIYHKSAGDVNSIPNNKHRPRHQAAPKKGSVHRAALRNQPKPSALRRPDSFTTGRYQSAIRGSNVRRAFLPPVDESPRDEPLTPQPQVPPVQGMPAPGATPVSELSSNLPRLESAPPVPDTTLRHPSAHGLIQS